jgi:hypothetical protein
MIVPGSDFFSARRLWVYGFFGVLLLLGLGVYADYGISWDEDLSRATGMVSLRYVAEQVNPALVAYHRDGTYPPLSEWANRDYGVVFELPACVLERLLHLEEAGQRYLLRHLLTFLVCLGGVAAVYRLGRQRFGDWRIGLIGAAWLVLSPRLFAESFYNSKDAVFMALFAVGIHTGVRLLVRPTTGRAVWHAVACAAAIDVRIMALILPAATLSLLGLRVAAGKAPAGAAGRAAGLYGLLLTGLVVAWWPYLWPAPWANLQLAFQHMSVYGWDNTVLYRGAVVRANQLPWHYAPVWIGITTPLLYLGALLVGLAAIARTALRQKMAFLEDDDNLQDLFFAALLLVPLLAIIGLHSVLYDGWRHLYFVYPVLLLVALGGWVRGGRWLSQRAPRGRLVYGLGTGLALAGTAGQMVAAHPNQQVYFNCLAGSQVATRYELDYWGLSFRQGLEYVAAHDKRPRITIQINDQVLPVAKLNLCLLPVADRQRLVFTETASQADYFISNYRWHPQPYAYPHEIHRVMVNGVRILSVFKLKN